MFEARLDVRKPAGVGRTMTCNTTGRPTNSESEAWTPGWATGAAITQVDCGLRRTVGWQLAAMFEKDQRERC